MNYSILVVDDDLDIVNLIATNLMNKGFNPFKAYNGLEAIKC